MNDEGADIEAADSLEQINDGVEVESETVELFLLEIVAHELQVLVTADYIFHFSLSLDPHGLLIQRIHQFELHNSVVLILVFVRFIGDSLFGKFKSLLEFDRGHAHVRADALEVCFVDHSLFGDFPPEDQIWLSFVVVEGPFAEVEITSDDIE